MNKPKILCYNIEKETLAPLSLLAGKLGCETVPVSPESYSLPILSVASGVPAKRSPLVPQSMTEGMLIFVNLPEALLDVLLQKMREKGIKVSLKAVLTPHNAVWDAHTIYRELCRERAELSK